MYLRILIVFLLEVAVTACGWCAPAPTVSDLLKKKMLLHLDCVKEIFDIRYAPFLWKRQLGIWELDEAYNIARGHILALSEPSVQAYHTILRNFFNSAGDYHVTLAFCTTAEAVLPFTVRSAQGHYFVTRVEGGKYRLPLEVGDEVVLFDNKPVRSVVEALRQQAVGLNRKKTDQALAELLLTTRRAALGLSLPSGECLVEVKKVRGGARQVHHFYWNQVFETVMGKDVISEGREISLEKNSLFFEQQMAFPLWMSYGCDKDCFAMGSRRSFLPILGKKLWQSSEKNAFFAYIFEMPKSANTEGKKIGYVRIPSFESEEGEVRQFGQIIARMEKESDLLIIDLLNNPGGSIFYTYALLSHLSDKPLQLPHHHLLLTQQEMYAVGKRLSLLQQIETDEEAQDYLSYLLDGYPASLAVARKMIDNCFDLQKHWQVGDFYTPALPLWGIDCIEPNSICFTKPLIVLINELDFSSADLFASVLQDNHRALLFGEITAGAGGYFIKTQFPNQLGINYFNFTASHMVRKSGVPIENIGICPDVPYAWNIKDLKNDFCDYTKALYKTIDWMLNKAL